MADSGAMSSKTVDWIFKTTITPVSTAHKDEGECIPIVQPKRCTRYLKLKIIVKRSTCFGPSFRPSSGAQNCAYSNGTCQTAAATGCYRG